MNKTETIQNEYLRELIEEKEFLESFRRKSRLRKIPVIDIETGRFLEFAVLLHKPSNLLEIGCGTGFSSYFLIKNLKSNGSYTGIDLNRQRIKYAEDHLKDIFPGKNLKFITGNALSMHDKCQKMYDFVFIDAAKFEYLDYLKAIEDKLSPGALVIADNIYYGGRIFEKITVKHDRNSVEGLRRFISYITGDKKYGSFIMDVGDGLSVSIYGETTGN